MNKYLITICLFVFSFFQVDGSAQIKPQNIINKLNKLNTPSSSDVLNELKKRNISEQEARKMAQLYGMSYDQFVASYLETNSLNVPSNPVPQSTKTDRNESDTLNLVNDKPDTLVGEPQTTIEQKDQEQQKKAEDAISNKSEELNYFGYDIFKNIPQAFEPAAIGPIDPGYLISPGDVLQLYVWGEVQLQYQLTVNDQGNIFIPTAGQFFVSGVAYKDLQNVLSNYLSKFYAGLSSDPPTTFLSLTLSKLKPIRIFALGEVAKPGGYNISSYATVFNALYSIGGPLISGSLRDIRVIRNNEVIARIDLYDYLLKGQLIGDVRLQDNDIVFIPPRGRTVTINGEVLRPAIYELSGEENLPSLITYSGGLKSTAYTGRAQIDRILPFNDRIKYKYERKIVDVDLLSVINNPENDFQLYDKDVVTVFRILNKLDNFVTISGAVNRPGTYELNKVPQISDLISEAYGLLPEAFRGKADIIRTRPDESFEFISFDLGKAINNDAQNNIKLKPRDQIKIYSVYELKNLKTVSISGYVKQPVVMTFADSLTLYDLVFKAGGLEDPFFRGKAYLQRGDIIRYNEDGLTTRIISFDLQKLLTDKSYNVKLEPADRIYIYKANVDKVVDKKVKIDGHVRNPGEYELSENMTPADLIIQAGGFLETSLKSEVYVNRLDENGYDGEQISKTFIVKLSGDFQTATNFEQVELNNSPTEQFYLQNNDLVEVRKNPNYELQRVVNISGEISLPGDYVLKTRNEKLSDLIDEAGKPTSEAYLFGTVFRRKGERVALNLEDIYTNKNSEQDITLQDGDEIFIPKIPHSVLLTGEVGQPGFYKFTEGKGVKDYIDQAGGRKDSSDYIIYHQATGLTEKIGFGLFTSNPTVTDGAIINVTKVPYEPPTIGGNDLYGTIKDTLAIIVSAITIIVLANRL